MGILRPSLGYIGRKIPDHYTYPTELRDELDAQLGQFPLFKFWGPVADIASSDWITKATLHIMETRNPTLTLTYLPHLDYNLQKLGPDAPSTAEDLRLIEDPRNLVVELAASEALCCFAAGVDPHDHEVRDQDR